MQSADVWFNDFNWGESEARAVAKTIPMCPNLQVVRLWGNNFGDGGKKLLQEAWLQAGKLSFGLRFSEGQ